jgi:hypothetical protein
MQKLKMFPKRIQSLTAVLLAALLLLSVCPIAAFAGNKTPTTTATSQTATAYCYKHPSCQGKHAVKDCPGPQRLTATSSKVTVGKVQYTVAATKPTTTSATTVTVSSSNRYTYTYTVSADNKTITERKYDTTTKKATTRSANVADYVDVNAPARTTKTKKDGKFGYQETVAGSQMKIWKDSETKTTVKRTTANSEAFFAYQAAIEGNISAVNTAIATGVGTGAVIVAVAVACFVCPAVGVTLATKVGASILAVGSIAGGIAGSALVSSLQTAQTTYADAKKYYYILKG